RVSSASSKDCRVRMDRPCFGRRRRHSPVLDPIPHGDRGSLSTSLAVILGLVPRICDCGVVKTTVSIAVDGLVVTRGFMADPRDKPEDDGGELPASQTSLCPAVERGALRLECERHRRHAAFWELERAAVSTARMMGS